MAPHVREGQTLNGLFTSLTKTQGQHKIFVGINEAVLKCLFAKNFHELNKFQFTRLTESGKDVKTYRDTDRVIIVTSLSCKDLQIEKYFTEKEVKTRLNFLNNFQRQMPAECGASCRSRELLGKACEIKTYRGACHFHR